MRHPDVLFTAGNLLTKPERAARTLMLAAAGLAFAGSSTGATILITEPTGLLTEAAGSSGTDPFAFNVWYRGDYFGASSGITTDFPRGGNGSVYLSTTGPNGFAQMNMYFTTPENLASLSALSYDWFVSGLSTTPSWQKASLILYIDPDGTGQYNGGLIYTPSDTVTPGIWTTSNSFTGNWTWFQFGIGATDPTSRTLTQWMTGAHASGFAPLSVNSLIDGIDIQVGPGAPGVFVGAADQLTYGFNGDLTTINFESAVPEPASFFLVACGLLTQTSMRRKPR